MSNSAEVLARTAPREDDPTPIRRRGERPHGNARRVLLLQTTLRLIADEGIDAVSHRSVAEAAGVPLGSTTYWFSSRQDMLRQALEYFARLEIETLRERLGAVLGRRLSRKRLVDEFTDLLVPQLGEARWRTIAQYALLQEAARQPELEPVCREWTAAWNEALEEVCAEFKRCIWDDYTVFSEGFTTADVATVANTPTADYFHPSVSGQAKLAEAAWSTTFNDWRHRQGAMAHAG